MRRAETNPSQVFRSKPMEATKDKTYYCRKKKAEACGGKRK